MTEGFSPWRARLRHAALVVAFYTAVCLAWSAPELLRGRLLAYADSLTINLPAFAGPPALWNPYLMSGYPAFADPQMTLWYPLRWLLGHGEAWWNAYVVSAFVLAGSFLYGYLYLLTRSRLAALVGGLVYCCGGFLWSHVGHPGITHAAAWIPLILWSLEVLRRRIRPLWVAVLAVAVTNCFLAGHPQLFVYAAGLTAFYLLGQYRPPAVEFGRWFGACALGWSLGLCLAAVQILPTLELRPHSARQSWSYEEFTSFFLPPAQLPQLLFPYAYGSADWFWTEAPCSPNIGACVANESTGYSGLLPLLLAGVGLAWVRRSRLAWLWLGWGLLGVLAALGDHGLVCRLLYHVPVLNGFRAVGRHLWGFSLAVAVLAALGVQALAQQPVARAWPLLRRASLLGAACLLLAWGWFAWEIRAGLFPLAQAHDVAWHFNSLPWRNPALGLPLLTFGVGLLVLWLRQRWPGRLTAGVLLAYLVVDLGNFACFWEWHRSCTTRAGQAQVVPEVLREWRAPLQQSGERICSFWAFRRAELAPVNLTSLWRMRNAGIDSPLALSSYRRLVTPAAVANGALADLLAIRYAQELKEPGFTREHIPWETGLAYPVLISPRLSGVRESNVPFHACHASRLAIVSRLCNALDVPDGTPVAEITLFSPAGEPVTTTLRAGTHTADWSRHLGGNQGRARHAEPQFFEPDRADGSPYLGFVPLPARAEVHRLRIRWIGPDGGGLVVYYLTLIDEATGACHPVTGRLGQRDQWREKVCTPEGSIYENLHIPLRRVWLADRLLALPMMGQFAVLQTGQLPDGTAFDPYRTALVYEPVSLPIGGTDPDASAEITHEEPCRVEIHTRAAHNAFLVLNDIYYPGWRAYLDGQRVSVRRCDGVLRGVPVPAGEHRVRFEFRSNSFCAGAAISLLTLTALLGIVARHGWRRGPRPGSQSESAVGPSALGRERTSPQ
jgi:hypothetical protein